MSYSSTVLADSPIVYYRLGEPSGTTADNAEGTAARDGTYRNTPTLGVTGLLPGDAGTAVNFAAASSQDVWLTTNILPAGSSSGITVEFWAKWDALPSVDTTRIIATWGGVSTTGNIRLGYRWYSAGVGWFEWLFTDGVTGDIEINSLHTWIPTTGTSYHIVVTHDYAAKSVLFYINGSLIDTYAQPSQTGIAVAANAWLSVASYASSYYWDDVLQEFAIFNSVLSAARVSAHYSAGTVTTPTWTTPADTVSMSTTPELKFNSPTSAAKQHFYLQLDTANTFDTGNLRSLDSSADQSNWAYWDGATWTALPSDGLPIAKAGNEIRYTVTSALSGATWYRRVRAGTLT